MSGEIADAPLTIAERPPLHLVILCAIAVMFSAAGIYALMNHVPGLWPLLDVVLFTPAAALFYSRLRGPNVLVIGRNGFTHRNSWHGSYRVGWDEAGPFAVDGHRIVFDYRDPEDGTTGKTFIAGRFARPLAEIAVLLNQARDQRPAG